MSKFKTKLLHLDYKPNYLKSPFVLMKLGFLGSSGICIRARHRRFYLQLNLSIEKLRYRDN